MTRLAEFMRTIAQDTYPEPPSAGHSEITAKMVADMSGKLPKGASILDVGCGQGVALELFRRHEFIATGITTNMTDLLVCQSAGYDVMLLDMHLVGTMQGGFDLIWARHVLEHSISPYFALHEFKRVLKPGGWLYVEVPAPGTACKHQWNKNHYSVFTEDVWAALIIRSGFEIIEALQWNLQTPAGPDVYHSFICRKQEVQSV